MCKILVLANFLDAKIHKSRAVNMLLQAAYQKLWECLLLIRILIHLK